MSANLPSTEPGMNMPLHERIERLYTLLEFIARNDAQHFSQSSKVNMRRVLAELQRIRLMLLDEVKKNSGALS